MKNYLIALFSILILGFLSCGKPGLPIPSAGQGNTPTITSLSPTHGQPGDNITVSGTGFSTTITDNLVYFNGLPGIVTAATSTSLTVTVPPNTGGSGPVAVNVKGKMATGPSFTYDDNSPVVNALSPNHGKAGDNIVITGTGFSSTLADVIVYFHDNVLATIVNTSPTTITVKVPANGTTGNVIVNIRGKSATGPVFTYDTPTVNPAPVIASIDPTHGKPGDVVTITGSGFSSVIAENTVAFNGVVATVTSATPTLLTVIVPKSTTGPVTVTVNGKTAVGPVFTYDLPVIKSISPSVGNSGTIVTLTGSGFSAMTDRDIVELAGVISKIISITDTEIKVTASPGVPQVNVGPVPITANGTVITGPIFTYQ